MEKKLPIKKVPIGAACIALSACSGATVPASNQPTAEVVNFSDMVPQNQATPGEVNVKLYNLNNGQTVYHAGGIATSTKLQTESLPTINLDGLTPTGTTTDGIEYFDVSYTPVGAAQAIDLRVFTTGFANGSPKTVAASYDVADPDDGRRVFTAGNSDSADLSGVTGPVIYRGVTEAGANGAVVLQIDDFDTGVGTFAYENNTLSLLGVTFSGATPSWTTLKTDVTVDNESGYFFGASGDAVVSSGGSVPTVSLETYGNIVGGGSEMIGVLTASGVSDGGVSFTALEAYVGIQGVD